MGTLTKILGGMTAVSGGLTVASAIHDYKNYGTIEDVEDIEYIDLEASTQEAADEAMNDI